MPPTAQPNAPLRPFTFRELHARTPGLTAAKRTAVFRHLPEILQRQAWDDLYRWADHRSALDFRDWCGDDA